VGGGGGGGGVGRRVRKCYFEFADDLGGRGPEGAAESRKPGSRSLGAGATISVTSIEIASGHSE